MSVRKWTAVVGAIGLAAAGVWWTAEARMQLVATHQASSRTDADSMLSESEIRDRDIAFFERRVAEDALGASDRSQLATLYMDRARASGIFVDYQRAEKLARRSLALRTAHNSQTFGILASALLARHDFTGALEVARRADSLDPGDAGHVALLGEIELELGDYAAATTHFSSLHFGADQFTIAARVARWRELTGNVDAARRLLRAAAKRVAHRDDLPREQVAWFQYRLGELELRLGRLDSAEAAYRRGLAIFPEDYRILGGLARVRAARQDWRGAIDAGSQAIATQLDPATLGTISDAYAALGDIASAAQYARAMTTSALEQPGPIHRAWGLFVLDHGGPRDVRRVLAKTQTELRTRHDVYGFDLLAWGLHKEGRDAEAMRAMQRALAQHTQDAQLFRHAAAIERALGDGAAADEYLDEARTLSGGGPTVVTVSR
jgi:tetratricopeptide (TPR) repeat protein